MSTSVPSERSFRAAGVDRVFVVQWTGTPVAADVDEVIDRLQAFGRREAPVRDFVVVVAKTASMPDHDGRMAYIRNVERTMASCERLHIVLASMPFINAFARGLVTTASIVPRYRGRVLLHDSVDACLATLIPSPAMSAATLRRSILAALT